jgi:hypothetical protein
MKKLFLQFSVLCLLMPLMAPTCGRSDEFADPTKGIRILLDVKSDNINANATKPDEKFSKSYSFKLLDEFKTRYNIDPSDLTELNVETLVATFNQANCLKLKSFKVTATFPSNTGNLTVSSSDCSLATLIDISATSTNPLSKSIRSTNFAPDIIAGKSIDVSFEMEAREAIASGFGATATLSISAIYKPK